MRPDELLFNVIYSQIDKEMNIEADGPTTAAHFRPSFSSS